MVSTTLYDTDLAIQYKIGLKPNGISDDIKTERLSRLKPEATDEAILNVSNALKPLIGYPVKKVSRVNSIELEG